ncbi:MAG: biotin/lipoyl-binding protein [Bacilli bacterium]|nr:biotin/lipoyl-binding protein [Bacilli bacterium]
MKVYKVKVNGKVYEVELEATTESANHIEAPVQAAPVAAPAAPVAAPATGEGVKVEAPMQGKIIDVKVATGQQVQEGDVLCVLEALKLANDIVAPCAGVVQSVSVSKGSEVENGQLLVVIKG